jgi:hypothetical protein
VGNLPADKKYPSHYVGNLPADKKHPSHYVGNLPADKKHPSHYVGNLPTDKKHPSHYVGYLPAGKKHPSHYVGNLNLMSLLGLTLAVSILVNDAIVVVENIHRHHPHYGAFFYLKYLCQKRFVSLQKNKETMNTIIAPEIKDKESGEVTLDDRHEVFSIYQSQCSYCKHFKDGYTCVAFPKAIPDTLLSAIEKHNKPIKGQTGDTTFELDNKYKDKPNLIKHLL